MVFYNLFYFDYLIYLKVYILLHSFNDQSNCGMGNFIRSYNFYIIIILSCFLYIILLSIFCKISSKKQIKKWTFKSFNLTYMILVSNREYIRYLDRNFLKSPIG
jgi:hypothetical protein